MRSTLIAGNGDRFNIQPLPQQQAVMLWSHDKETGKVHQLVVPVDMAGAFTQAIEAAAHVADREKAGPGTERAATPCGQVSDGIACSTLRVGVEKLCPDCNPWRPKAPAETVLRCLDADACKVGQVECPHFHLCCAGAAL